MFGDEMGRTGVQAAGEKAANDEVDDGLPPEVVHKEVVE